MMTANGNRIRIIEPLIHNQIAQSGENRNNFEPQKTRPGSGFRKISENMVDLPVQFSNLLVGIVYAFLI